VKKKNEPKKIPANKSRVDDQISPSQPKVGLSPQKKWRKKLERKTYVGTIRKTNGGRKGKNQTRSHRFHGETENLGELKKAN